MNQPHQKQQLGSSKHVPLGAFSCLTVKNRRECVCEHRDTGVVSQGGGQGAGAGAEFEIPWEEKPGKKQGVTPSTKQRNHLRGVRGRGTQSHSWTSSHGCDGDRQESRAGRRPRSEQLQGGRGLHSLLGTSRTWGLRSQQRWDEETGAEINPGTSSPSSWVNCRLAQAVGLPPSTRIKPGAAAAAGLQCPLESSG